MNASQTGSVVSAADITSALGMSAQPRFTETKLVGSDASVGAQQTDPNLVNPWGVSHGPAGPLWISDNNSGFASIYAVKDQSVQLNAIPPVTIAVPPGQKPGTAAPTGQVFNSLAKQNAFMLSDGKPAVFLFATEDGTISGWNGGTQSVIAVDESHNPADGSEAQGTGAVYKGLAIANSQAGPTLYAANFRHATVDVYDKNFNLIQQFTDPNLLKGYAPFNVQVLDGKLFVTFALQDADKHDDLAGAHHGFVDEYDLQGHLIQRVASGGPLDSPWGLAIAPQSFGALAGDLLVGEFGSGTIDAINLKSDHYDGALKGADGKPIVIGDLWSILPGGGGLGGSPNALFFTAGVQQEMHGLFGSITPHSA